MKQMAKRVTVLGEPAVWDGHCYICGTRTAEGNTNTVTFRYLNTKGEPFQDATSYACSPEHQTQLQRLMEWKYPQQA